MAKQRYDTEITRGEILTSARTMFAERGFAGTTTEDVVGRFGLTRGALYHHFGSKQGLFEAVVEAVQADLTAEVTRRATRAPGDPVDRLRAGFQAYLDVAMRPDVRRILMVDGPAVLGWDRWHEIDRRFAFGITRRGLEDAVAAGAIAPAPLDELAHVLLGAVTQAALELGRAEKPRVARRRFGEVIDLLIDRLRAPS